MKEIHLAEYKTILLDMLIYFDKLCRDNDIKYSLIGGSLIGAIRHHGFIPWDDDIDVILMPEEYEKLLKVIKNHRHPFYSFCRRETNSTYYYNFMKMTDTRTVLQEASLPQISDYGAYIDIFKYQYMPDDDKKICTIYNRNRRFRKMFSLSVRTSKSSSAIKNFLIFIIKKIGRDFWLDLSANSLQVKNAGRQKMLSDLTSYPLKNELQLAKNFSEYIDWDFEGHTVMITKNYDDVLRTTFGDYMKLPPEDQRKPHHRLTVYWK